MTGFGAVLALSVICGVVMLLSLSKVNAAAARVGTRTLPAVQTINEIAYDLDDYQGAWSTYVAVGADRSETRNTIAGDATQMAQLLANYRDLVAGPGDARTFARVRSEWSAYRAAAQQIPAAVRTGAGVDALQHTYITYGPLSQLVNTWTVGRQTLAAAQIAANHHTYVVARALGVGLLAAAVLLGLAIALTLSRSIKVRVGVVRDRLAGLESNCMTWLSDGLSAFAEGDLSHRYEAVTEPIANPANDGIGQIARSVNQIRDRVAAALSDYNATAERLGGDDRACLGDRGQRRRVLDPDGLELGGGRPGDRRDRPCGRRRRRGRRAPGAQ